MKVLHVIPSVAARYGGPSHAIGPMCRALAAAGLRPTILTTDADGPGRLPVAIGAPIDWEGVPALVFSRDLSEAFKYSRGLSAWVHAHAAEFDVVHIHAVLSHASLAAAHACRRARVPYVVRPLGTLAPWSLAQKGFRKRVLMKLAATRMLSAAAAIHCTSSEEKRGIEALVPSVRSVVIPLGIDPRCLEPIESPGAHRSGRPYVLTVSRLHPKKNLETLIAAFLEATDACPEWRLVIAGAGDAEYARRLAEMVRSRQAGDRVELAGWVEGARKRELMRGATLFALVSLHENFGVSLLEALACGVPAVATKTVDLAEPIQTVCAGWITDASHPGVRDALATAIHRPEERAARGAAARRLAERFAWPGIAAELTALYEDITDNGSAARPSFTPAASTRPRVHR